MKAKIKNITIKVLSLLMIAIMSVMVINKGLYIHSHILNDGTIVFHAHPFNKSTDSNPIKTHHHTSNQLVSITHIQLLFILAIILFSIDLVVIKLKSFLPVFRKYEYDFILFPQGRAPPL